MGSDTRYPYGYGTGTKTMAELRARYEPKSHPEFARRLFAWLESMDGLIGIGSGWRTTPHPVSAASRAGRSFHQDQTFASGFVGYIAVDLVATNGDSNHRAPTWDESETAPEYGLHTFINNEPWHIQPIETRGWQTWVNDGRPDPDGEFVLPGQIDPEPLPPQPPPDPEEVMTTILIQPAAAYFAGGVFTVDGHPVSPETLAAFEGAGEVVIVQQDHPHWDAATWERIGSLARARYTGLVQ